MNDYLLLIVMIEEVVNKLVEVIEVERAQFYRARAELELSTSSPDEPELYKF